MRFLWFWLYNWGKTYWKNLVKYGNVYANKMQVVYDVLVKYADEDFYHVVSVLDEFLIPVEYEDK